MASTKITYQDILKNSNPVFDPALKAEIENRLKRVNASARTNPNVIHRRSKAFQKAYAILSELDYNEVERVKTLPKRIKSCGTMRSYSQKAAAVAIRKEFGQYENILFSVNVDMGFGVMHSNEVEQVLNGFTYHLYRDLL